jgi:hypothetical protein
MGNRIGETVHSTPRLRNDDARRKPALNVPAAPRPLRLWVRSFLNGVSGYPGRNDSGLEVFAESGRATLLSPDPFPPNRRAKERFQQLGDPLPHPPARGLRRASSRIDENACPTCDALAYPRQRCTIQSARCVQERKTPIGQRRFGLECAP